MGLLRFVYILSAEVSFYRQVLRGVMTYARRDPDIAVEVVHLRNGPLESEVLRPFDGVISSHPLVDDQMPIPAITVSNNLASPHGPAVVSDDRAIGQILAQHFAGRGHRRLAYCGGTDLYCRQRAEGFVEAAQKLGIGPVTQFDPRDAIQVLSTLTFPIGVMCSNDGVGAVLARACHKLGLEVPGDVAIAGVDDDDLHAEATNPPLSTVVQRTDRIGALAAELLKRRIGGEPIAPITLVPPGPLIIRESSERFSTSDPLVRRALAIMEKRLTEQVNIDSILLELGVSRRSLETAFRGAFGCSPAKFLANRRIERAKELLAGSDLTNSRIAELSGFGTAVRFNQAFRHAANQTPGAYRRQFR